MTSLRIIVVGGVAGGMSAATRARRMNENASIIVLEKGGYVSFANCGLPYYLAGRIETEDALLVATPAKLRDRFNLDVRVHHEVMKIDRAAKSVEVLNHETAERFSLRYDKLILAVGASPIIPPIEHMKSPNVFLLRSMEDTQAVHRLLKQRRPTRVSIVGAGFIGLEMADAMRQRGLEVTVIEKAPHALPPLDAEMATFVGQELARHQVNLITGTGLASFRASHGNVTGVVLEDGRTIDADMVLLSIGVRPNTTLATDAGLTIGTSGGVAVDEFGRTSDADVYAVGDVAEVLHGVTGLHVRIPLAGPANRNGRLAGEHAATGSAPRGGASLGTAIVEVFDLAVGVTGLSERDAKRAGLNVETAYVIPAHHASYYPGAEQMRLKLVYESSTGRILGAQAVGGAGVDKRIDVIATAIHFGGTVEDLTTLDLAYAPQFGSAKDPIHMAGFVAANQRSGVMHATSAEQVGNRIILDVRTEKEFAGGSLRGAINIPVDQLRNRLDELDPTRPMAVFCQSGMRAYVAQRILQQHGFADVANIKGGYLMAAAMN